MIDTMVGASFNLLKPITHNRLEPTITTSEHIFRYLKELPTSSDIVIDFETTGLDVLADDFEIVGVGIAHDSFPQGLYFPFNYTHMDHNALGAICSFNLIAHNVGYDGKVLEGYFRSQELPYKPMDLFPWKNDTLMMFKALASEGYAGQQWSLKSAQKSVLGWQETNEVELDDWLIANGHVKTKGKPDKGKMWMAPHAILGKYCGLDAQSTLALYNHFTSYYMEFPDLQGILEEELMTLQYLEIEEFFHGLHIDETLLDARIAKVQSAVELLMDEFYNNSEAEVWITEYNNRQVEAILDKEPPEFTKTGKTSVRYTKWQAKVLEAKVTNFFNPNSKDQLAWLFYDCMFESTPVTESFNWRFEKSFKFTVTIDNEVHQLDGTPSGKRKVDKKILPKLGKAGALLSRYNELIKLLGYMNGMKESIIDGVHHTQLRLYGTLTGRCSGTGGVNIQQLPKVREYLDCLTPRPGHVFIQMDVDALEPVVLAELSEDIAMMNLYGPGAKPNDIYLYVGASIPALRDEICAYGYDPLNPTAEAIAITKKKAKRVRGICKVVHLSAGYGAGAGTIFKTLVQAGVSITLEEVTEIRKSYWETFAGVTAYQNRLKSEWAANGGWFLNGRGLPVSVDAALEKDILNRCIQSTGHWNLLTYLKHLQVLRKGNPHISITPIVTDFHDECIFEVPEAQAKIAMLMFKRTWDLTNKELGGIIPLSGEPEICHSFSDFKCEGGYKVDEILEQFNLEIA